MNLYNCKKGQITNYLAVIVWLFLFIFIIAIGTKIFNAFESSANDIPVVADSENAQKALKYFGYAFNIWDGLVILFMAILIIGVGVTSYRIATPPVFFIVSFIMAIFLGLISYIFNFMAQEILSQQVFDSVISSLPYSVIIVQNFHWIGLLAFVVGSITLYAKRDQGQYV